MSYMRFTKLLSGRLHAKKQKPKQKAPGVLNLGRLPASLGEAPSFPSLRAESQLLSVVWIQFSCLLQTVPFPVASIARLPLWNKAWVYTGLSGHMIPPLDFPGPSGSACTWTWRPSCCRSPLPLGFGSGVTTRAQTERGNQDEVEGSKGKRGRDLHQDKKTLINTQQGKRRKWVESGVVLKEWERAPFPFL